MLAVTPLAKGDLVGRLAAERERGDRHQPGVERLARERRPFLETAVRQVAMRAATERRRVRGQRQPVFQRRAGVQSAQRTASFASSGFVGSIGARIGPSSLAAA